MTSQPYDQCTSAELEQLYTYRRCPDCRGGTGFANGPQGGLSINRACMDCGAEFNVTPAIPIAQRTSPYGEPNLERLRDVFHFTDEHISLIQARASELKRSLT